MKLITELKNIKGLSNVSYKKYKGFYINEFDDNEEIITYKINYEFRNKKYNHNISTYKDEKENYKGENISLILFDIKQRLTMIETKESKEILEKYNFIYI